LFQNPDDLAFRESGRLHAKFPVDPAARKFYLEHPLILGGTTHRFKLKLHHRDALFKVASRFHTTKFTRN
ncbi:hypothetical protein, partial [Burkholderia gladioli]|uniref:hypothetical protein n=1 Tax=Burkholderia gladioli TaxID=28095 RepID=UPI001ABA2390